MGAIRSVDAKRTPNSSRSFAFYTGAIPEDESAVASGGYRMDRFHELAPG
jgi:hypothetical protein